MCIPISEACPINEIQVESDNISLYGHSFQKYIFKNYTLYYNNNRINNSIVVKLVESEINPRYITTENFIFDDEAFKKYREADNIPSTILDHYPENGGGYDGGHGGGGGGGFGGGGGGGGGFGGGGGGFGGGGGGIGGGGGGWRNLDEQINYGDAETEQYILSKIGKEARDDTNYIKIDDKLFIRNYIGFETYEGLKTFVEYDFSKEYKTDFPNNTVMYIGFFAIIPFLGLVIFRICRLCYKDNPDDKTNYFCVALSKFMVFITYISFFIGYFIYSFIRFIQVFIAAIKYSILKKNKTEKFFINNFFKYLYDKNDYEKKSVSIVLVFILLSFPLFVLGWVVHYKLQKAIDMEIKYPKKDEQIIKYNKIDKNITSSK